MAVNLYILIKYYFLNKWIINPPLKAILSNMYFFFYFLFVFQCSYNACYWKKWIWVKFYRVVRSLIIVTRAKHVQLKRIK